MLLTFPGEWRAGLDALRALPDGGAVLLVGATDRGKTTLATQAAQILAGEMGEKTVAVVDADIGQSEIGPPGTVGAAWAQAGVAKLHDLRPAARFFVGAFAPAPVALEHVVATGQAVTWARANGARRIVVDTTGWVSGPAARRLKVAKAQVISPSLLLGLAKGGELEVLLAALGAATGAPTLVLPTPDSVGRKSTGLRATRRLSRLSQALGEARALRLPLGSVVTVGATLGTGAPLADHLARWAGTALRLPVVYAEQSEDVLNVFVDGRAPRTGWEADAGPVATHFGARAVRALSLSAHENVFLGLHDAQGKLLGVGRFVGLDAERREMIVSAPPPVTSERVCLVAFGRVRVAGDGAVAGEVRPGAI